MPTMKLVCLKLSQGYTSPSGDITDTVGPFPDNATAMRWFSQHSERMDKQNIRNVSLGYILIPE